MTAGPIDDFKSTVVSKKAHGDKESKDILIGSLIAGQYEILDSLGSGGMSTVYRANDLVLGRQVAVKLLKTGSVVSEKQLGRFQREARAVASLKHPRISPLFTAGLTEDNLPYIVMELIEGQPLSSIIKKTGRMETLRAIDVALEIADALAHAHEKGVIHRDLKPSNVLITADDRVSIIDFGIAKVEGASQADLIQLTVSGEIFGSPRYMSPEQCRADEIDHRCDIYALGCLMYELLSGEPPFVAASVFEVLAKHLTENPRPLGSIGNSSDLIDPDFEILILRCLSKSADQRPQTMIELASALESIKDRINSDLPKSVFGHYQKLPDNLTTAVPWLGDPIDSIGPTEIEPQQLKSLIELANRLLTSDARPDSITLNEIRRVTDKLSKRKGGHWPDVSKTTSEKSTLITRAICIGAIAESLLMLQFCQEAERLLRELIALFQGQTDKDLAVIEAETWLQLADCLFYQKIKTTDALTLYSSYLYRAKDLGLPGDSRDYALRESRLADCHLIDESYKLAEIAYEKASLLWQHLDNDCNAGIALLRGGYARQRRGKNISDLTEDLEKAVSDIGAAYGMESVYHQVGRMLYREIIRGAHQSDS